MNKTHFVDIVLIVNPVLLFYIEYLNGLVADLVKDLIYIFLHFCGMSNVKQHNIFRFISVPDAMS